MKTLNRTTRLIEIIGTVVLWTVGILACLASPVMGLFVIPTLLDSADDEWMDD